VNATAQQVAYPAGWYLDPSGSGQRYWNGVAWTGHVAPPPQFAGPLPQESEPAAGDWIGAALLPLLMPVIGLIAGIVWTLIGGAKRQPGMLCMVLSLVAIVAWSFVFHLNG
jgi:hypothetical protein